MALRAGTDLSLPHARGWYRLTGHYFDPAAAACHYVANEGDTDPLPSDTEAVAQCEGQWVVSKLEAIAEPARIERSFLTSNTRSV